MSTRRYTEAEYLAADFAAGDPLVDGLLYKGRNVLFVAKRKAAKTIFSLQLAESLANGLRFLDYWGVPKPVKVVYYLLEGADDDIQKMVLRRMRRAMGLTKASDNLVIRRAPFLHLRETAKELVKELEEDQPDLLILDPFYRIHRGTMNDDGLVGETTGALNVLAQEFHHATWMPHHEHRVRHDTFGAEYEDEAERYAGSWVLTAWADAQYGFRFNVEKKKAVLTSHYERIPRLLVPVNLVLRDTPTELLFELDLRSRIERDLITLQGMGYREIARHYGEEHHENVKRVFQKLHEEERVVVYKGGWMLP